MAAFNYWFHAVDQQTYKYSDSVTNYNTFFLAHTRSLPMIADTESKRCNWKWFDIDLLLLQLEYLFYFLLI